MASTADMKKLNVAKGKLHYACTRFLEFHSKHAAAVWEWRQTGNWDPELIEKYNELADEVDLLKTKAAAIQKQIDTRRPYMRAVA